MLSPTHWLQKTLASVLMAFIVVNLLMFGLELLPQTTLQGLAKQLDVILPIILLAAILFAIVFSIIWHKKETKQQIDYTNRFTRIIGLIRYWLAFEIATYGFAKVFKTQFSPSYIRDYTLLKDASGFDLTWFYFGYSDVMTMIVAVLQIGGSILLLFRRTTLLGCFTLLPVMTNILLINLFYDIAFGAFINSLMFTIGLSFILSFYWPKIKSVLFSSLAASTVSINFWLRNVLRVLVIGSAAGIILYFGQRMNKDNPLSGVWNTTNFIRNNDTLNHANWQSDTLLWNKIYFDYNNSISLNSNPFYFEKSIGFRGTYTWDAKKLSLSAPVWRADVQDTLQLQLQKINDTAYHAVGTFKKDSIRFTMYKLPFKH